jgi:translation initiation factor IF-3
MKKQRKHKINSEVRFPQVRLVGMGEPKIMSSFEASQIAKSEEKDLILINESQDPPIVRIENYNKFIYDIEKSEKEKKKNSKTFQIKEIQLSTNIADNDLKTKSRKGKEFLNDGNKVKVVLQMNGRERQNPEAGEITILKYVSLLDNEGVAESMPKYEGNRWQVIMKPKKKN